MPDQSYRTFLKNLERQGHLLRFTKEVDPLANLSAIEWRAYNEMGRSSLFTNVKGHRTGRWQVRFWRTAQSGPSPLASTRTICSTGWSNAPTIRWTWSK